MPSGSSPPPSQGFPYAPDYIKLLSGETLSEPIDMKEGGGHSSKRRRKSREKSAKESPAASLVGNHYGPSGDPSLRLASSPSPPPSSSFSSSSSSSSSSSFSTCRVIKNASDPYTALVFLALNEVRAVSGLCSLTLLKGTNVTINGYRLLLGVSTDSVTPPWIPAATMHNNNDTKTGKKNKKFSAATKPLLESIVGDAAMRSLTDDSDLCELWWEADAVVCVRGVPSSEQEWLVAIEDQSIYQKLVVPSLPPSSASASASSSDPMKWHKESIVYDDAVSVLSAAIGYPASLASMLGNDVLNLDNSWRTAVDQISTDSRSANFPTGTRTIICGAKGVGKSTCLRYTINRLLSTSPSSSSSSSSSPRAIAVIDCDLGQPEFNIPGCMSLHIITGPVLTPPHLHLQTPELSYYLGELTSKNEPETFATALGMLMQRYRELHGERLEQRDEYIRTTALKRRIIDRNGHHDDNPRRNSFAILAAFDAKDSDDLDSDGRFDDPLPLVVNTDGAVRFMGAEILTAVVEIASPTHVLHISTEKDRDLPAIVMLRSQSQSHQHLNSQQQGSRPCVVFTLEPGRSRPSKTLAADLRALRFVSYFLRNFHSTSSPQPENYNNTSSSSSSSSGSGRRGSSNSGTDDKDGCTDGPSFSGCYIRTGAIVDRQGYLAMLTLRTPPLAVHFREVVLRVQAAGVPARLALAAMNASMVGILCRPRTGVGVGVVSCHGGDISNETHSSSRASGSQTRASGICQVNLSLPTSASLHTTTDNHNYDYSTSIPTTRSCSIFFDERHSGGSSSGSTDLGSDHGLWPCLGMGIVRCIDLDRSLLYLITPIATELLQAADAEKTEKRLGEALDEDDLPRIVLVKGPIPLPHLMMYCPEGQPLHPYMSNEVTGEGASAMKARNNVKRRGQQ